jgi:hypothetical protein
LYRVVDPETTKDSVPSVSNGSQIRRVDLDRHGLLYQVDIHDNPGSSFWALYDAFNTSKQTRRDGRASTLGGLS